MARGDVAGARDGLRERVAGLTWVQRSLLVGAACTVLWMNFVQSGLTGRLLYDGLFLFGGPLVLAVTHGRRIGWRVDRRAIRNTVVLAAFVLPFYLVGSTLPTIRTHYPIWETSAAPAEFVPHSIALFFLALATETYYRGLLCVGIKEIGFKAVFISPVLYTFHHWEKPMIEFLLSGPTDVLFGAVDYRSDSILPSVIAHGAGLVLLDWLVLHDRLFDPTPALRWLEWLPIPL